MSDIFISYASADRETARKFADALERLGWSVWWDREIPLGKTFDQAIEEELNVARCVVVLWSKESVRSRWVRTEASAALDRECLVPALIDTVAIPLEFKRIQSAMLADWEGNAAHPEFQRLVQAVRHLLSPARAIERTPQQRSETDRRDKRWWPTKPQLLGAGAVLLLVFISIVVGKKVFQTAPPPLPQAHKETTPATSAPSPTIPNPPVAPSSHETQPHKKVAPPQGAFTIKIGDSIDDGVPGPGAGAIETSYGEDVYVFTAAPGQRVYFRMVRFSTGMSFIRWRLVDDAGAEIFSTCLGCTEPGVQILSRGGTYTLTVGSNNDASTGTYQLRLFNVPAPSQFSVKIGDEIKEDVPGPGAGAIEVPGAEDIYTFTAAARQRVYFRIVEYSAGMASIKWRLVDENGMEVFNTCLGCSEPGVQSLLRGGTYALTLGNKIEPATGTYRLRLFEVPAPQRFSIKIGDRIKPGTPGAGAGVIESPGAEDIYVFSALPGQKVSLHLLERSTGMDSNKWRLVDENGMEVFNTCLGCTEPGLQTLRKGGVYTLVFGTGTDPSTGTYSFEIGSR